MASAPVLAKSPVAFKSILFATDLSFGAEAAATYVRLLASTYGSHVYALHVLPANAFDESGTASWHWQFARASLESFLDSHSLRDVPHKALVGTGNVAAQLIAYAKEMSPDLIVVGTHGRTGVNKFMLGSVAEQVFRTSGCAVLTVGPHVRQRPESAGTLNIIVVACDFTESCANALRYAASVAERFGSRIVVVNAVDEVGMAIIGYIDEVIPQAEMRVRKWVKRNQASTSVPWLAVARFGHAADVILQTAFRHHADLIVMGTHGSEHPGLAARSIAATAYKVVSTANCPVLTVKHVSR